MTLIYRVGAQTKTPRRVCLQGPVKYTVVGMPTIVDGVVSGLSPEDYVQVSRNISYDSTTPFEFGIRFKTPETFSENKNSLLVCTNTLSGRTFGWLLDDGGVRAAFRFGYLNNTLYATKASSYYNYLPNTWYRAKATINNGVCKMQIWDDAGNLLQEAESNYTFGTVSYPVRFLCVEALSGGEYGNAGKIDLNETYIKVNNQLWYGRKAVKKVTYHGRTVWGGSLD